MKWGCCLYFLACSITLLIAQGTDDGCVTCALGNFFKTGLEDWVLPSAAGALQFLVPDSVPAPDTTKLREPDKQWTNDIPGSVIQPDLGTETSPDEKCDPNGRGVSMDPLP